MVASNVRSFYFGRDLLNLDLYHFNCLCHPQSDSISAGNYLIYGNQKHNYLNTMKAEQLMVGKKRFVSTSLINSFGTSIIDQHFPKSIKLIGFYHFFPQAE